MSCATRNRACRRRWWLAGAPLEGFSVALFVGIMLGTLSSICISATLPELIGLDVQHFDLDKEPIAEGEA